MVRVVCFIRPHRLEHVKSAIASVGVSGMTVTEVRGVGDSKLSGFDTVISMPIRSRIEVVVPDDLQEETVAAIVESARTGETDDGKVFVEPIIDAYRIRTDERGGNAI